MDHEHNHSAGLGVDINHAFARDLWYLIAGVVGLFAAVGAINYFQARKRLRACKTPNSSQPTVPNSRLGQAWATVTALIRELSLPQIAITKRGLGWLTPPSLGRSLILVAYWATVIYMMTWKAIIHDVYFWERVGYRGAWVSIAQLPFIFLLAMKTSLLGWLVGSSHERLSWLHRWAARTLLITATVHGFYFWTEWARADFVSYELKILPLVRYGLGAWAVMLWSAVVGLAPIRGLVYEFWVLQHIVSAILMLWLLHRHVPQSARVYIWMSVAFLASDRAARWVLLLVENMQWSKASGPSHLPARRVGHALQMRTVGDKTTIATVSDVRFSWRAGQHIYLWVPRLGPLEAHPYSIANACEGQVSRSREMQLVIRAHGGFSKRIRNLAARHPERTLRAFVTGPYGAPPRCNVYETLVLIASSTGGSFILPMLESVVASSDSCVKRIDVVLLAKTADEIEYYAEHAREAAQQGMEKGLSMRLHMAITSRSFDGESGVPLVPRPHGSSTPLNQAGDTSESKEDTTPWPLEASKESRGSETLDGAERSPRAEFERMYVGRPDLEALIREPVEQAWGETAVVVCGGRELTAGVRTCVSRLSDERAVHKGSGAQGIYLHAEEFAF
ncbi:hypothetical protein CDD81_238 [Ophiocordyceps australis]|uniref:ferric-chelate reductase (NADPH) n=1 Tax=Ophiocordyceps australis TaxID=1399860 RepID=A0A2C5Y9K1_9HYPO|nr:hypothetical protein CDD81_238 [Ophiocordyceps australis]